MTRAYCVDGTNLVRGCHGYGGPDFRAQEEADAARLVSAFGQLCAQLDGDIEIEVIFDGATRPLPSGAPNLRVRFAHEIEADDLILDRVRASRYGSAGRVTVVTGDSALGRQAEEEGAHWLRVKPRAPLESVLGAIERRFS
jgi:hypothetical protein